MVNMDVVKSLLRVFQRNMVGMVEVFEGFQWLGRLLENKQHCSACCYIDLAET